MRSRPWVIPRATYRVQLHSGFPLSAATALVPYLHRLGISHLYVSPLLKARAGSTHGYDVIDHSVLNPDLGTAGDLDALADALHRNGMGLILDVVPNHMGILSEDNAWWLDVLENGPAARYADYFDIDWNPSRASMRNRLLVPVLGDSLGEVLHRGELQVEFDAAAGAFSIHYFEHRFPLDPREYPRLFMDSGTELADWQEFQNLMGAFAGLPTREETSPQARTDRYDGMERAKRWLAELCGRNEAVRRYVIDSVASVNDVKGDDADVEPLATLLDAQPYRLANWRVAGDEINYRRFFDINTLAALRMDRPEVFAATHALILEWIERGIVDGLRIDHPDGLYDPRTYFQQLQQPFAAGDAQPQLYVVAEKILADHERLPADWAIHGDTGYEFGAMVNAWLVDKDGEESLTRLYRAFTGERRDFAAIATECKRLVMSSVFAAELGMLTNRLDRLAQRDRRTADFTASALREALVETIASFPIYRTYVSPSGASDEDRRHIEWAIGIARRRASHIGASVFDFLQRALLGEAMEFAMKFQQVTAPVAAKGVEDTALYRYYRLASLNEVGTDPRRFSATVAALHQSSLHRAQHWPHTLLGTSTHDSKRSEDVRSRVAVLSEMPQRWRKHLHRWNRLNRGKRITLHGEAAPSRADEYLIYQTLVGVFPGKDPQDLISRVTEYAAKAARESKAVTSWINPDEEYETALRSFVENLLDASTQNAFLRDLESLCALTSYFGCFNSLAQTLLKLTSPGVPDFYQGTELPRLNLVDPDSRLPVDFDRRQGLLAELESATPEQSRENLLRDLLENWSDGRIKLFVAWQGLQLRRRYAQLFAQGRYEPLIVAGGHAERLCAFARSLEDEVAIVIVPRHFARLCGEEARLPVDTDCWADTQIELPPALAQRAFTELFTGAKVTSPAQQGWPVGELLTRFPFAVLVAGPG